MFFVTIDLLLVAGAGASTTGTTPQGALLGGLVSGLAGHKLPCLTASSAGVGGWV